MADPGGDKVVGGFVRLTTGILIRRAEAMVSLSLETGSLDDLVACL